MVKTIRGLQASSILATSPSHSLPLSCWSNSVSESFWPPQCSLFQVVPSANHTDERLIRLIWAAVLMCTAASQSAGGLQATRFFLGLAEASIAPDFSIITSMWYKKSEQPLRHGAWFMGNVCAGFFGSLLAYAVGKIESIQPWRVSYSSSDINMPVADNIVHRQSSSSLEG